MQKYIKHQSAAVLCSHSGNNSLRFMITL